MARSQVNWLEYEIVIALVPTPLQTTQLKLQCLKSPSIYSFIFLFILKLLKLF